MEMPKAKQQIRKKALLVEECLNFLQKPMTHGGVASTEYLCWAWTFTS